ncbi:hypothetical protein [Sunxiuqinia sp. sy24]|uniref:hypothetical protein n=1 Tax=Sunxiuqinia sp. sy24 TaxID=3461495 RepID=UPI004045AECB
MKTITRLLMILTLAVFAACEGPVGPPGPPGDDGLDGLNGENGYLFEIEGSFSPANEYTLYFPFPDGFTTYDTDIVMVYILWDQVESGTGEWLDVWRALPQTVIVNEGVIQYNFDYTVADVEIFIEETVGELLPEETDNQVFRIAVLPAELLTNKSVDINNLDAVMKSMDMNGKAIKKVSMTK